MKNNIINGILNYLKKDFLIEVVAIFIFSISINLFSAPNKIVCGGLTGVATILNSLFGVEIGTVIMVFNIPLLLIGYKALGKQFVLSTLRITVLVTIIMDYIMPFFPVYQGEQLLASIFGGALCGVGIGIIYMRGGSTGGSDIIVKLIRKKYPHYSFGSIIMFTDIIVVGASALVFGNIDSVLYGVIMIFTATTVIDKLMFGRDARKLAIIITQKQTEVTNAILNDLSRGLTIIDGKGGFSMQNIYVLLCVAESRQIVTLKKLVNQEDPSAFVIVTQATETLGKGFKGLSSIE